MKERRRDKCRARLRAVGWVCIIEIALDREI
jgi:hypothetical protein